MLKVTLFVLIFALNCFSAHFCLDLLDPKEGQLRQERFERLSEQLSRGDLVNPHQKMLLFAYLLKKLNVGQSPERLFEILERHPELKKLPMREYTFSYQQRRYFIPPEVKEHIRRTLEVGDLASSRILEPGKHLTFWRTALPEQSAKWIEDSLFLKNLRDLIPIGDLLRLHFMQKNSKNRFEEISRWFRSVYKIVLLLDAQGLNSSVLRQTLLDFTKNIGLLYDPSIRIGLTNPQRDMKGLLQELHFLERLNRDFIKYSFRKMKLRLPPEFQKTAATSTMFKYFEQLGQISYNVVEEAHYRLRNLSLMEAPYRGCIGKDCSTITYFEKALEPGSYHFTITDSMNISRGHVTVVFGEALEVATGVVRKIAFLDKMQNFSEVEIPIVLNLVSKSLLEAGYILSIPKELKDEHTLSGYPEIYNYFKANILPHLKTSFTDFAPYEFQYGFKNGRYSRIEKNLDVFEIPTLPIRDDVTFQVGPIRSTSFVDPKLDETILPPAILEEIRRKYRTY